MSSLPLISIITPSFNQAAFIEDTISSVAQQDYLALEHIIVDGGSTDGTRTILERQRDVRWTSEPDGGQADAVNKGFARARGDVLGWINSDDVYQPGALRRVAEEFADRPDVDVVYGDCAELDESGPVRRVIPAHPVEPSQLLLLDFRLYQPTFFFRRRAIDRVGMLDTSLHLVLDYDYILRMVMRCKASYVPATLAAFRPHPRSKTSTRLADFLTEYLVVFDRVFSDSALSPSLAKVRRRAYSNLYLACGVHSLSADRRREAATRLWRSLATCPHPMRPQFLKALLLLIDAYAGGRLGQRTVASLRRLSPGVH